MSIDISHVLSGLRSHTYTQRILVPTMGSVPQYQFSDFRSEVVDGLTFFTPKQRVPVGTAILRPEDGVTEETITPAFRPITIRGKTFQNRIWVAPMCMYSCEDGMFSDFHVAHYGQWAMRGSALTTIEATAVTARVLIHPAACVSIHIKQLS